MRAPILPAASALAPFKQSLVAVSHALLACSLLAIALPVYSAPPRQSAASASVPARTEPLDHKTIHDQYNEGNFDAVIASLETFMKRNPSYSHDDSVFVAKHLAVVYTANPATREKGKYFMHRLLELLPSAKLVDMYVSEEIDRIFDKIKEEFLSRHQGPGQPDPSAAHGVMGSNGGAVGKAVPAQEANTAQGSGKMADQPASVSRKRRSQTGIWLAGGTAVVVAGLAAAYVIHQNEEAPDRNFRVPQQ